MLLKCGHGFKAKVFIAPLSRNPQAQFSPHNHRALVGMQNPSCALRLFKRTEKQCHQHDR